ncbi:hypothetical protein [Methanobacterium spitsbergense]|uniref:Uncharacterized protein n=1 Tax=Methanobacterium spitsbergense TaxID=2874285 RepID=A0A8T5V4Q6_9EURY|nr:hypothetical protein [Methanobacterium spitsbergense]MBZ2166655.1 hypothetical protein [Methanobacterium spitsbergense]
MAHRNQTKLRRSFIIQTLLDGNEWHTQEILKKIGDLEYKRYCRGKGVSYQGDITFIPETINPVNNPKLSIILGNLVKEGILRTRAISRFEKEGSKRSSGNVYWLVKSNKVLYLILKKINGSFARLDLLSSEYGKKLINLDLVDEITKILNPLWTEEDRQFIFSTFKISPTALYNSLEAYFIKDKYWFKSCYPKTNEIVRLHMKEKFLMDLKFWLYNDMQTTPLRGMIDIKLIFDVSVSIKIDKKEIKQNSKIESLEPPIYMTSEQVLKKVQFDEECKPTELVELENELDTLRNTEETLKRYVYDCLREFSEEKGEEKKQKRDELIKEYYIVKSNLKKKLVPLERKFYRMNKKYMNDFPFKI